VVGTSPGDADWGRSVVEAVHARTTDPWDRLSDLKRAGLPITNPDSQLRAMIPFFRNRDSSRATTQSHTAHERVRFCSTLTNLQVQANGDVTNCTGRTPIGNIKTGAILRIWELRPRASAADWYLQWRGPDAEKNAQIPSEGART